jgi:hypothetical protein
LCWRWSAKEKTVDAVRAVDTATHPDHQGKGIFRTLTLHGVEELTRRGVGFVFNTPNEKSRPGYLKMGWSVVGRPSLWVAPRRIGAVARVAMTRFRRRQAPGLPENDGDSSNRGAALLADPEFERLIESALVEGGTYRTPVDAAYVRWRYVDCPGSRYGFTPSDSGNVLAVHRTRNRSGAREVAVCELLFDRSRATAREISGVLCNVLAGAGADYGVIAPPASARGAAALALAGFVPAPRTGPVMTVRPMAGVSVGLPNPLERASWTLSVGDIELF